MGRVIVLAFVALLALIVGAPIIAASQMSSFMMAASGIQQAAATNGSTSCDVPMVGVGQSETGVTLPQLTAEQVTVAHALWTAAHQVGMGDRAAIIGIATFYQESTLGGNPSTKKPNSDVDVGPGQQRALPGWYANGKTVAENVTILNDPMYAARTFFLGYKVTAEDVAAAKANGTQAAGPAGYTTPGLAQVSGWDAMPVTHAAQKVQRSAFPDAYAKHEPLARQLVAKFNAESPPPAAADPSSVAVVNAGESVNAPLCDPPGTTSDEVANCPDSGLAAEKGLTPDATRVLRCAYQQWPDLTYGGVRPDSMEYHPSGRAVDIMTPGTCSPTGQKIADWARANYESLGVVDVIWCQQIWSVARSNQGWRGMSDRGSDTANHKDHVHITVAGNSAGTSETAAVPEGGSAVVAPVDKYDLSARHGQAGSAWSSGFHTGLDLTPIPAGSTPPLKAVKAGTVTSVTTHAAYGNLIKIDHGGDVASWYAHLSSTKVKEGQKVTAGTVIGNMGRTGNVRGANPEHLHLEIRQGGAPIDPDRWLAANGVNLTGSKA